MSKQKYIPTVGLEIHAELKTKTKMFCNSKNDPDEKRPNVNVCPICLGHPGTLPTVNKEAVRHVLKIGVALGSELADFSEFDRKNYFYPDIPKGYQISQYKYPLVKGGSLNGIQITRVHLEEDTARSVHDEGDYSLVDFNRAGVPLMELVTEPVIHSAREAGDFARELQLLLRTLGVAEANMEKGEMRVEVNISVAPARSDLESGKRSDLAFGTKVEVKNLNSFRSVERAIEFEVARHIALLNAGEKIVQETRGWDEDKGKTFSQRQKEESHDYRYFPDPDIPKFYISEIPEFAPAELKKKMPELPWERRKRYAQWFSFKPEEIEVYVSDPLLGDDMEGVALGLKEAEPKKMQELAKLASNYIISDFLGLRKTKPEVYLPHLPQDFADLILMVHRGEISSRGAKNILAIAVLLGEKRSVKEIAKEKGLLQQSDAGALKKIVEEIIKENKKAVAEYKAGKTASLMFLVGQGMKKSKGSANPGVLKTLFEEVLK